MALVHLHRHSEYSLLDGLGTGQQYAERAAELGQTSMALTDHGSLAGILYHIQACEAVGIKPILGMEAYFKPNAKLHDNEHRKAYHMILLAQNLEGWHNLMRLSSKSYEEENFYYKPCIDYEMLSLYNDGLIATSSCLSGYFPQQYLGGKEDEATSFLENMLVTFGDRFYFEVQPHAYMEQQNLNSYLIGLAQEKNIPLIATVDAHYPRKDNQKTQRLLVRMNTSKKALNDKDDEEALGPYETNWLMSEGELLDTFREHHPIPMELVQEAVAETVNLADRCDHIEMDRSPKIPKATSTPIEAERVLRGWCNEGLERIGKSSEQNYLDRLEEELGVMRKLGVLDYFVIVGDMVRWAKEQGIRVGPGRGSAGGSLVLYLSRVTAMDPIGYGLLFERFLNEYRTEIPDVDIDFQHNRRDEVKQYIVEKYGKDKVVDVAAFQSFGMKSAIKDVCRAMGIDYAIAESVSKELEGSFGTHLEDMRVMSPKVDRFARDFPEAWGHATLLEGQVKNLSKHPAAVIVTDRPAVELIPMMRSKDDRMVTQYSERANAQLISPYGFLKIDMLVTDALTVQADTILQIEADHGIKIDFEDVKQFPVVESPLNSDPKVVERFVDGRNLGVFQFGASRGMLELLRAIKPTNLDHLIAANALYRPGTLTNGMAYQFANRKNGEEWDLPHNVLEPFLGSTFGIITFQEQVMQVGVALGDFSPADSAVFLKIVAKGIARDIEGKKKMQTYYDKFAAGASKKGLSKVEIDRIWGAILQMSTYAFNRSHSAGYAVQGYQDKWLKYYYALQHYAALLTTETSKVPQIVREARQVGVKILPPDINVSGAGFTIDGNSIRYGLLAVKQIGDQAMNEIIAHRPYETFKGFCEVVAARKVNSRGKEYLLNCGAFDTLGERADWSMTDKSKAEKDMLGFSLSSRDQSAKQLEKIAPYIDDFEKLEEAQDKNGEVQIGGEIVNVHQIKDKNKNDMAFVSLEYGGEEVAVTIFSSEYTRFRHMLNEGATVLVKGTYQTGERAGVIGTYICPAEAI